MPSCRFVFIWTRTLYSILCCIVCACVLQICQPGGWRLSRVAERPTFFVTALTDDRYNLRSCAVLSFYEPLISSSSASASAFTTGSVLTNGNGNGSGSLGASQSSLSDSPSHAAFVAAMAGAGRLRAPSHVKDMWYQPKSLVLIAGHAHQHEAALRSALATIYTVFVDNNKMVSLESMIGRLLSFQLPATLLERPLPNGVGASTSATASNSSPSKAMTAAAAVMSALNKDGWVEFTLGAGERQTAYPPHYSSVPASGDAIAQLFRLLGVHSCVNLVIALLVDVKLVLLSSSLSRITTCFHAIRTLLYPFRYCHTSIPLLPSNLLTFVDSPTPFFFGIHASAQPELPSDLVYWLICLI